jgi:hypothetical protein
MESSINKSGESRPSKSPMDRWPEESSSNFGKRKNLKKIEFLRL